MLFKNFLIISALFSNTALFATPNFCRDQKSTNPIFCQDFQHREVGLYSPEHLSEDWPNLQSLSNKLYLTNFGVSQQRVEVTEKNHNRVLKIKYPKDLYGSAFTGASWVMKFPQKYQQLSLEYKVKFKQGFLYDREGLFGGKLPGLMGGETISGGASADGKNGWTSRIMWGQKGRGLGYLYYPDMRDDRYNQNACPRFGLDHELCVIKRNKYFTFDDDSSKKCLSEWAADEHEFRFKTGRFYKIKQLIKMNTLSSNYTEGVIGAEDSSGAEDISAAEDISTAEGSLQGKRDGQLKIWLDDKLVVDCNNIRFRDVSELAIDSLLFSTFFGGNTPESSAHPHDETIYFDDFIVREN